MPPPAPPLDYRSIHDNVPAPWPPVIQILLAAVALIPLSLLIVYPLALLLPIGWDTQAIVDIPTSHVARYGMPTDPATFVIVAQGHGRGRHTRLTYAYINYSGREIPGALEIDFATMTCHYGLRGYHTLPPRPINRMAILDHLQRAGFDPSTAEAQTIADRILMELRKLAANSVPPVRAYNTNRPATYHHMSGIYLINLGHFGHVFWIPWYWPFSALLWLLAFIPITRRLIRRYRERCIVSETMHV